MSTAPPSAGPAPLSGLVRVTVASGSRRVDLVLPETGVCGVGAAYDGEPSGCCAPVGA